MIESPTVPAPCEKHKELVHTVQKILPDEKTLYALESFFKLFGDSTRIKILYVLSEGEMCVCDIAAVLSMTQSAISHQLGLLRRNKLVKTRRAGKTIYYSLADDHVKTVISMGIEHIGE